MIPLAPDRPAVLAAGDAAALVVLGDEVSLELNARVHALLQALAAERLAGVRDLVPGYCTLLVHFDPLRLTLDGVQALVERLAAATAQPDAAAGRLREVPTVYGGPYGPDLAAVARHLGMSEAEVVRRHSAATYTVYMLGFAPGQPYLGGLPPELVMPRLASPRPVVPAGTVAIANQAAIYAQSSPGGWRLLGRTSLKLLDPTTDPPNYLQPGDRVRFVPVDEAEYLRLGGERMMGESKG